MPVNGYINWCYDLISMRKNSMSRYIIPGFLLVPIYKVHAPISSIIVKPRDMNSLTLLDALCPVAYTLYSMQYT